MINEKIPYLMFKFPTQKYAQKYCNYHGLVIGNSYFILDQKDNINIDIIVSDNRVTVGREFFKQHFKKDTRSINLNKLLYDDTENEIKY